MTINGRNLEGRRTGVGRYLSNVLNLWTQTYDDFSADIFFRNHIPDDKFLVERRINSHLITPPPAIDYGPIWENIYLPKAVKKCRNADIYFSSNYTLPLTKIADRHVVTIFDISYIAHPEWFPKRQLASLRPLTGPTVRNADMILTGSLATKLEILKYYDIDSEKIKVTNLGIDNEFLKYSEPEGVFHSGRVKRDYELKGKIVLFVGLLMNRRNVPQLIEAVSILKRRFGDDVTLVLLGKNHTHPYQDINRIAANLDMATNLKWIEYCSDDDVFGLYKAADVFMCTSLYEGFNITPLEALGLGVPVICSNLSSLPEVVGDAALMVEDPSDPVELAKAIESVLSDEDLARQLIEKGKNQASQFSWERCAEETMNFMTGIV